MSEYKEPSEEFMRAICHSGSPAQTCELCGRLNFDLNGEYMEEGELERYLQNQKDRPEKYHGQDNGISWGTIGHCTAVWGCPCNAARRFEDFIWSHRRIIFDYLKVRTNNNLKDAEHDSQTLETINPAEL